MKLDNFRTKIDQIDTELIKLLAKRQKISKAIALYKKELGLKIYQPKREGQILRSKKRLARKQKLDPIFIEKIFKEIFKNSRQIQREV